MSTGRCDALPFPKLHPQTPQYANTAAELEARAAVLRALSWSEVLGWGEKSREIRLGGIQKKKYLTIFLSFFCLCVSRLQTSLHDLNGHQSMSL